jgi:uncharacterized protein (TIGR03083 family)
MDVWAELADERRLLADDLDGLESTAWSKPTTCGDWTVHQLTAHLTVPLTAGKAELLKAALKARGNIDKAIAALSEARATQPPSQLVATIRDKAEHRFAPPGMGPEAPLTDAVVHGIEVRRGASVQRTVAPQRLTAVLDFTTSGKAKGFVPPSRTKGLRFETTDIDWSTGPADAPVVRGPAEDMALAVTGRPSALDALEGDGVAVLRSRL